MDARPPTAVMGEANIDLRESAIQEKPAVLEVSVIMGELKDERVLRETSDVETDLVIKGSVVMGSLKIED